ncbi:hypothetical protein GQ457_09G023250 [Hibiscus cannabinus]
MRNQPAPCESTKLPNGRTLHSVAGNTAASNENKAFSGVIILNHNGLVMGSCVKIQNGFFSVCMAEARAAAHGLSFAEELEFHHIILKSDSRTLVQKLKTSGDDYPKIRPAAHAVTAVGKHCLTDTAWYGDAPLEVVSIVEADQRNTTPS